MKEFYDQWTEGEIKDWVNTHNALVLFEEYWAIKEAKLVIHGKMTPEQTVALMAEIIHHFGGVIMTSPLCNKINEFAQKWYNRVVLRKKARVFNIKRKK